jgi:hypothetical protein
LLQTLLQALLRTLLLKFSLQNFIQVEGIVPNTGKVSLYRFLGDSYLLMGFAFRLFVSRFVQIVRRLSWTLNKDIAKCLAAFERKVLGRNFVGITVNENWEKRHNKN